MLPRSPRGCQRERVRTAPGGGVGDGQKADGAGRSLPRPGQAQACPPLGGGFALTVGEIRHETDATREAGKLPHDLNLPENRTQEAVGRRSVDCGVGREEEKASWCRWGRGRDESPTSWDELPARQQFPVAGICFRLPSPRWGEGSGVRGDGFTPLFVAPLPSGERGVRNQCNLV